VQLLNSKGFDRWAGTYDRSVGEGTGGYPFEGYYDVLNRVCEVIGSCRGRTVLDLGVGTGLLSVELFRQGATVVGVDFSPQMLLLARQKMPEGEFVCADLTKGLPDRVRGRTFDAIVSSYALHHLEDNEKSILLREAVSCLVPGGVLAVADIAFETAEDWRECRSRSGDKWDESEHYTVAEQALPALAKEGISASYEQISSCAGVLTVRKASPVPVKYI